MLLFSELFPAVIYETNSPLSGPIRVVDFHGERRLMIGDLVQSISLENPIGHKVWGRLSAYPLPKKEALSVLILGLGGATVAHVIAKKLNPTKIVGVEIDPVVVEVGRKYFGLDKIKNLTVVIEDARSFIKSNSQKYDYVIVDTYLGSVFPKALEGSFLLKKLRDTLSSGGVLVFNRIFRSSKPRLRLRFISLLEKIFGTAREEIVEGPSDAKNYLYWVLPRPRSL